MQVGHNFTEGMGPTVKKSQNASCKERGEELPESSLEPSIMPFMADTAIRHTLVSGHRRVESGKQNLQVWCHMSVWVHLRPHPAVVSGWFGLFRVRVQSGLGVWTAVDVFADPQSVSAVR